MKEEGRSLFSRLFLSISLNLFSHLFPSLAHLSISHSLWTLLWKECVGREDALLSKQLRLCFLPLAVSSSNSVWKHTAHQAHCTRCTQHTAHTHILAHSTTCSPHLRITLSLTHTFSLSGSLSPSLTHSHNITRNPRTRSLALTTTWQPPPPPQPTLTHSLTDRHPSPLSSHRARRRRSLFSRALST